MLAVGGSGYGTGAALVASFVGVDFVLDAYLAELTAVVDLQRDSQDGWTVSGVDIVNYVGLLGQFCVQEVCLTKLNPLGLAKAERNEASAPYSGQRRWRWKLGDLLEYLDQLRQATVRWH